MIRAKRSKSLAHHIRLGLSASLIVLLVAAANAASAQAAPVWRLDSLANTTATPNGTLNYYLQLTNVGDADSNGDIILGGNLPSGLTADDLTVSTIPGPGKHLEDVFGVNIGSCAGDGPGSQLAGATAFTCTINDSIRAHSDIDTAIGFQFVLRLSVDVGSGAASTSTATFNVEGGGAPAFSTIDPTRVTTDAPSFGIDAFDTAAGDAAGNPLTQAAAHPNANTTTIDFNTIGNPEPLKGDLWPVEPARDVVADLPVGFVGSTAGVDQCSASQLANSVTIEAKPLCPVASQVGITLLRLNGFTFPSVWGPVPVFNMVPPPSAPARFGFNIAGTVVTLDARLRSAGDYGLSVDAGDVSEGVDVAGTSLAFWGVPADASHDSERACPGQNAPWQGGNACSSPAAAEPRPFFRNPTSCTEKANEGLPTVLHIDSWEHPGAFDENGEPKLAEAAWQGASSISHELPGYPFPTEPSTFPAGYSGPKERGEEVGIEGCEAVPFDPQISVQPTTNQADSPSGLSFDLTVPQDCWKANNVNVTCQSDLRKAVVRLPQGMSINPSQADGLGACTPQQVGLTSAEGATPIHFDTAAPTCPDSSKLGTVEIETPLIEEHLTGSVYLAAQNDNPFKSLLALYIVAEGNGVIVKLPAHVEADSNTGRLSTVVDDSPQLPFSQLHLQLFGGDRGALITPPTCGTYSTETTLTPWSHQGTEGEEGTPIAQPTSPFTITQGPGGGPCAPVGFAPKLSAGTQNPLAGAFSPFALRLTRADGSQRLAGLDVTLPPGMSGKLAGIPYCSDAALGSIPTLEGTGAAQLASPSCPGASQVGTVSAGAGAGPNPFYVQTGRAYLAGPYKGAPLSLAIVTPALAGPFDLGNVLVRSALFVDPTTAQGRALSDPLPTILDGIPLDLRDVRVNLDRNQFTLNPTNCEEMSVAGTVTGTEGGSANVSSRFQVGNCEHLPFKPNLRFRFKGGTHRTDHPALSATLTAKPGEANIARAQVKLPKAAFLDNAHIGQVCTRVQFSAHACPPASVYGYAKAITPLLDAPLQGPVYLRSSSHQLPDLVADLNGQIEVALAGKTDSVKGALRNTFEAVPDAPVSKFSLTLFGGKRGLIELSSGFCKAPRATVKLDGQNGRVHDTNPIVASSCPKKPRTHGGEGGGR